MVLARSATRPPSHHLPDGRFQNPWPGAQPGGLASVAKWLLWDRLRHQKPQDPQVLTFPLVEPGIVHPRTTGDSIHLTWIGHSTVLLQVGGLNILTDPMWSHRASPFTFAGPRRWVAPPLPIDALPSIDLVLLSHDHYDHLDDQTVCQLVRRSPQTRWFVPLGVAEFVRRRGARDVQECDWWHVVSSDAVTVACAPAQHFSGRTPASRGRTLWCSWSVTVGHRRLFFGGDSGYHPEYSRIGAAYGPFDVILLPIGAYEPRWFMRPVHMDPDEAAMAYDDLRSSVPSTPPPRFVPIHWGTFRLTEEPMDDPPRRLRSTWQSSGRPLDALCVLAHGETVVF